MTIKIKDKKLYDRYIKAPHEIDYDSFNYRNEEVRAFLKDNDSGNLSEIKKVVNAILDDEKVELEEQKYNLIVNKGNGYHDYHCAFQKLKDEDRIVAFDSFDSTDLNKVFCQFTQEEIDKYNADPDVYVDLNSIKVPLEETDD